MKVKIKRLHPLAEIPEYGTDYSAGMDLKVVDIDYDDNGNCVLHTGLAFEIPEGYAGFIFPRSSNAKKDLILTNSVGIIDADYRGEVTLKYKSYFREHNPLKVWWSCFVNRGAGCNLGNTMNIWGETYKKGDKAGQIVIMPFPKIEFEEVAELSDTQRGTGGYGSTGR